MTHPPRMADLNVVVPRMISAVHAGLAAFVVLAISRNPLDLELNLAGQLIVLLLLVTAAVAVTGYRHRPTG
ncbi:MAG: hypothetical protein NVS3B26_17440 [Mycobacteriales bacterium]